MVGSAALVSAMAGDAKKAAQMLDTLAPEVWVGSLTCRLHNTVP